MVTGWPTLLRAAGDRVVKSEWFVLAPVIYVIQLSFELVYRVQNALVHLDYRVDFLAFYTGARLLHTTPAQLYSALAQSQIELAIVPALSKTNLFVNPPLAGFILIPLANLPFVPALAIFIGGSIFALCFAGVLLLRSLPRSLPLYQRALLTASAIGYAGVENIGQAQWGAWQLLAVVAGVAVWKKGFPLAGGVLLSVVMVKPQLGLLLLPALLLGLHWRAAVGFVLGCSVWALSTLLLVGTAGVQSWLSILDLDARDVFPSSDALPAWATLFGGRPAALAASVVLTIACLALLVKVRRHLVEPAVAVSIALAMSFVSATLAHRWDTVLLAFPLILIMNWNPGLGLIAAIALGVAVLIPHTTGVLVAASLFTVVYIWWRQDSTKNVSNLPG